jgi:hypothetical protein
MIPLALLGLGIMVLFFLVFAAGVNVNSNNGMININKSRKGIFPRIKFSCRCCGKK